MFLASFQFNEKFEETDRENDDCPLLDNLKPEDFRPDNFGNL